MTISYLINWFLVAVMVVTISIQLKKFVLAHRDNRGVLITWTAQCVLALASLVGLVLAQLHQVNLTDTHLNSLFLAVYLLFMFLYQWTEALSAQKPFSRFLRLFLVLTVVYALITLALLIFPSLDIP